MANRVPLVVDQSTLYIKELPLADNLDLTGCGIVGISSFLPGTGGGQRFIGIVTFGDGNGTNIGAGLTGVYVNDGLQANYLKATNLTNQRIITAGVGGTLTDSGNLTFDGINFDITGSGEVSANWKVGGATTFTGAIDANGALDVDGTSDLDQVNIADGLNVTAGISTFAGDIDANADIELAGNIAVTGLSTFTAEVDINGGGKANTFKVEDLTDNRVVIAGTSGELEDSANLTFDGSTLAVTGNITATGNLNYTTVTDIQSTGIVTAQNGVRVTANGLTVAGVQTSAGHILPSADSTHDLGDSSTYWRHIYCDNITTGGGGGGIGLDIVTRHLNVTGFSTFAELIDANGSVQIAKNLQVTGLSTFTGAIDANGALDVDGDTNLDVLQVDGAATFTSDVTYDNGTNAGKDIVWDESDNSLEFADDTKAVFGTVPDLEIYHVDGGDSIIHHTATSGSGLRLRSRAFTFKNQANNATIATLNEGDACTLYHNNGARVTTTSDGTDIGGTGSIKIPVGTTAQRNSSPADGDIRYNSTLDSYEGYGNSVWGGLGGGTEVDVTVSSTSATNLTTFAKASYRSASLRIQIVQGSAYQTGRYLMIHDGTTATIVEEAAIATGSMLGTISAAINSANVEIKVTMGSASSATVTTIIDKISV